MTWLFTFPFTLADIDSQNLYLNFSLSGTNPHSSFHLDLYNADYGKTYTFTGTTAVATSSTSDIALTYVSNTEDAFSSFAAAALFFDGSGSEISSMTIYNLNYSAVPEPSNYTLLALGAAGLFLSFSRRKSQS